MNAPNSFLHEFLEVVYSSCDDESPMSCSDNDLSKILLVSASSRILLDETSSLKTQLDEVSLSFPSDDDSSNDSSSIEIIPSKDSTGVDLSLSYLSIPLDEDDEEEDEDLSSIFE